jgi:hypothetical protein
VTHQADSKQYKIWKPASPRVASFFCDFNTRDGGTISASAESVDPGMQQSDGNETTESDEGEQEDAETIDGLRDYRLWDWLFNNKYFTGLQKTSAFLIVDGVDTISRQCRQNFNELLGGLSEDRVDLLGNIPGDSISSPTANSKPNVKFLILGQSKLDEAILNSVGDSHIRHIAVTEKYKRKNIEKFISSSLGQSNKLKKLPRGDKFREETIEKLAAAAQGCFESLSSYIYCLHKSLTDNSSFFNGQ